MHDRETPVESIALPWRLFGGLLLVSLIMEGVSFLRPFSLTFGDHLLDALSVLYALFLAFVCFHGSWKLLSMPQKRTGRRFIPALLGMGTLWTALMLLGWVSETIWNQQVPTYPSLFRVLFLGAYPFFITAVLLLPSRNLSRLSRLRILLDSLIIMATVTTLYVSVVVVPILVTTRGSFLEELVGSLFTAADLVLLFCLLSAALQSIQVVIRQVLLLLTLAAFIILIGHVVFLSLVLSTQSSLMLRPNPGVLGSLTLIAVAAQMMRRVLSREVCAERGPTVLLEEAGLSARWRSVLISTLVLIIVLLLSLTFLPAHMFAHVSEEVIEMGGTSMLLFLVLRQLLAAYELNILKQDLRVKNAQLAQLATTDPLTEVFNYRTLVEKLDEALVRAQETHTTCSVLFLDIDHFKIINDRYGHQMGDRVLRYVTVSVTSLLRAGDCLGRWGGEEFVAVLPERDLSEGYAVAEAIRILIAGERIASKDLPHVTCSLGVATYPHTAIERELLIACADQALYRAKRLGRNQVCTAQVPEGRGEEPST